MLDRKDTAIRRHSTTRATFADAEKLGIPPHIFARRWLILASLCVSLLSVMMANGGLNLALPKIANELGMGSLGLTWVVEIYSLLFAALLFTFASVSDRYGRKKVMQLGLVLFVASSFFAGFFATKGIELILARAVMGIGGAMVMPTTLSVINVVFPPQERPRAVAIWTAIAGVGMMLGFVIGGVLLDHLGWQSTFFLSGGVAVLTIVANQFLVVESRDERQTPVDWFSGVLSTAGLLGLVYGIMEAPSRGLDDWWVIAGLVAAVVCLTGFVFWQRRSDHPMLDVRLFRHRSFGVSAFVIMLAFFALGGVFFGVSQLFMLVLGYGAFQTAIAIIPLMIPMLVISPLAPVVAAKIGSRWTVSGGILLVVVGFCLSTRWPTIPSLGQIYLGILIISGGLAFAMTPSTSLMMSSVPRSRSGMGSAMNDTTRELGAALGIAVLGALLSSGYTAKISITLAAAPEQIRTVAEKSLAGALAVSAQLGDLGDQLALAAKEAWMDSFMFSMIVAAFICSFAAIVASIWLPHRERWAGPVTDEEPEEASVRQVTSSAPSAPRPAVAPLPDEG